MTMQSLRKARCDFGRPLAYNHICKRGKEWGR